MRKFLANLMTQWWFLALEAVATPIFITVIAIWLSVFVPVLPLNISLVALGFYINRFGFDTGDMVVVLGIAFLMSWILLDISPVFSVVFMALPVGFLVSAALGNWMDKLNQDALHEQAIAEQERNASK